ncbi:MAG: hypothetical protein WHT27_00270 [candidate division WOR-3 bacterium]|jgi:hypothetical protein
MKLILNCENVDLKRRIEQFRKHKRSGEISLEDDKNSFIIFDSGNIVDISFKGKKDLDFCLNSFYKLKKGNVVFIIEDEKKQDLIFSLKKLEGLQDYIIIEKDDKITTSFDDKKVKIFSNYINQIKKSNILKTDFVFFHFKKVTVVLIFKGEKTLMLIFKSTVYNKMFLNRIKKILFDE